MPKVDRLQARAKLTRTLRVVGTRDDGYHELEAEMVTLDLADEIELETDAEGFEVVDEVAWVGDPGAAGSGPGGSAFATGRASSLRQAAPLGRDNLVVRALESVGRQARVRLVKRIPSGAGLGGGSADAAAVLRWAGVLDPELAAGLGADVPFCVVGGRALVSGIGEAVEPLGFEAVTAVLVTPALVVSTPDVYRAWDDLGGPAGDYGNDLEPAALLVEPRLGWWRDLVSDIAGERPRLAGSGGTWFLEGNQDVVERLVRQIQNAVRAEQCGRALVVAAVSVP